MKTIQNVVNTLNEPVIVTDADFTIEFWNKTAEKVYGYHYQEAVGKNISQLLRTEILEDDISKIKDLVLRNFTWTGHIVTYNNYGYPLYIRSTIKKVNGNFLIIHRLRDINYQELIRSIVHDFQEPLRSLEYYLEEGLVDEAQKQLDWLMLLSQNMLDFFSLREDDTLDYIVPRDLFSRIEQSLAAQLKETGGQIESSFGDVKYYGSLTSYGRLFQNLISNALKYSDDPKIKIEVFPERNFSHTVISDNGEGIAKENYISIFEPFKRFSTKKKGIGIGLAECKKIVDSVKGHIWVESILGQGSKFHVILPTGKYLEDPTYRRQ